MGTSGAGQSQAEVVLNLQLPRGPPGIPPTSGIIWGASHCFPPSPGRHRAEVCAEGAPLWPDTPLCIPSPAPGNVQALGGCANLPSLCFSEGSAARPQARELSASLMPAPLSTPQFPPAGPSAYWWCERLFACKPLAGARRYVSRGCHRA